MEKVKIVLNEDEARCLLAVREGVDVKCVGVAKVLRGLERRSGKDLVVIGKALDDTSMRAPYFGAQATEKGIELAEEALKYFIRRDRHVQKPSFIKHSISSILRKKR